METVATETGARHPVAVAMVLLTSKPLQDAQETPWRGRHGYWRGEGWGLEEAEVSEQAEVVLP